MKKLFCWQSIIVTCTQTPRFRHCSLVLYCSSGFCPYEYLCQNIFQIYSRLQAFALHPQTAIASEAFYHLNHTCPYLNRRSHTITLPATYSTPCSPKTPFYKCHFTFSFALFSCTNTTRISLPFLLWPSITLMTFSSHLWLQSLFLTNYLIVANIAT